MGAVNATLVWFRQDLRLQDNPAVSEAVARGGAVVPVYVYDPEAEGRWAPGVASRRWLHRSLSALDETLRASGSRLIVRRGRTEDVMAALARGTGAGAVYWNRRYEPAAVAQEKRVSETLGAAEVETRSFNAALLHEPWTIRNRQGKPFRVFTPYWRTCLDKAVEPPAPLSSAVLRGRAPKSWPESATVAELELRPGPTDDAELDREWTPGEEGARRALDAFVADAMVTYAEERDRPGRRGTSRLSPHLHFGEIGPRQIWAAVEAVSREAGIFPPGNGARVFLTELGWREFAHHLLYHFPDTPERAFREEFEGFQWAKDEHGVNFEAWRAGRTGYPIVDAGMRELRATGWMHNRVRMVAASFLVKHLRLQWQAGAAWVWDALVDADLANNTLGWQWTAGCGADAAPYFRVFNPVIQGTKFDADGAYVRRWVPELAMLPKKWLHAPWEAPVETLVAAGVVLGENYPRPMVDHVEARAAALAAYGRLRG